MSQPTYEPVVVSVEELKPRMKHLTITFKIVEKGETRTVTSRADNEEHRLADAIVGDSTGVVVMPLWDQSIEELQVGETYTLVNGYTTLFKGFLRLNIGKYGEISRAEAPIEEVNTEKNMSGEHHEQVRRSRRGSYGRRDYDRRDRGRRGSWR